MRKEPPSDSAGRVRPVCVRNPRPRPRRGPAVRPARSPPGPAAPALRCGARGEKGLGTYFLSPTKHSAKDVDLKCSKSTLLSLRDTRPRGAAPASSRPGSLEQRRGVKPGTTFSSVNLHLSVSSLSVSKQSDLKTHGPEEVPVTRGHRDLRRWSSSVGTASRVLLRGRPSHILTWAPVASRLCPTSGP